MNKLVLTTLPNIPLVKRGDDIARIILNGLRDAEIELLENDVIVIASKIVSKAEGRVARLRDVTPSARALELAHETDKDAREIELMLQESSEVVRARKGLIVTRHHLGFVSANAGIDHSNVQEGAEDYVLLLPRDPDATAEDTRKQVERETGKQVGIVIADSHGRPHRLGTVGIAIGSAGIPALEDWRGRQDLFDYELKYTDIGLADMLASAATLLFGQAREGTPIVHVRGAMWHGEPNNARTLVRPKEMDLFP
ncbi:coenzyme F420-0:L-glutamate ligase [Anaerolineae bacterium CFX7]|nr:coenzyme F420-0:L-glutamate ligase [Anaerolineae bacterium CFX7]